MHYWATRLSVPLFACKAHSFACSGLLASLAPFAVLTCSLARSLRSWDSDWLDGYFVCVFFHFRPYRDGMERSSFPAVAENGKRLKNSTERRMDRWMNGLDEVRCWWGRGANSVRLFVDMQGRYSGIVNIKVDRVAFEWVSGNGSCVTLQATASLSSPSPGCLGELK